jgi:uncharacterized protein DUF1570
MRSAAAVLALTAVVATRQAQAQSGGAAQPQAESGSPSRVIMTGARAPGRIDGAGQMAGGLQAEARGDQVAAATAYRLAWEDPAKRGEAAAALNRLAHTPGAAIQADDASVSRVMWQLGPGFSRFDTPHFVILSDCSPEWTSTRGDMLERTRSQFYRVTAAMGLPAYPHTHKLMCVLFNDHGSYQAFAKANDGLEAGWVAGYYATLSNRIVFYNDATSPVYEAARGRLKSYEEQMRETRGRAEEADRARRGDQARRLHASADDLDQRIRSERSRLGERAAASATAKTVHEAVHLLAFNSGLQLPDRDYPFWLSEGLATSFETDRPGNAFGPDRPWNTGTRQDRFDELRREGRLAPLERIVGLSEVSGWDGETADAMYCQSFALFTYLFQRDPAAVGRYMRALSDEPAGRISRSRQLELFTMAFGDPASVERGMLTQGR